jgi:hypothetical protein
VVFGPQVGKFVKNIDFLGQIKTKNWENTLEKSLILDSSLGWRARGLAIPVLDDN